MLYAAHRHLEILSRLKAEIEKKDCSISYMRELSDLIEFSEPERFFEEVLENMAIVRDDPSELQEFAEIYCLIPSPTIPAKPESASQTIMKPITLDLTTVNRDAYAILAAFRNAARIQGRSKKDVEMVVTQATSGNYDDLLSTIMQYTKV